MPVAEGSPLFCTKLTRLRDGVALAVGNVHALTDGVGAMVLGRSWASQTFDVSRDIPFRKYRLTVPDVEIRHRLSTPTPDDPSASASDSDLDESLRIVSSTEAHSCLHQDTASAKEASDKATALMMGHLQALGERT